VRLKARCVGLAAARHLLVPWAVAGCFAGPLLVPSTVTYRYERVPEAQLDAASMLGGVAPCIPVRPSDSTLTYRREQMPDTQRDPALTLRGAAPRVELSAFDPTCTATIDDMRVRVTLTERTVAVQVTTTSVPSPEQEATRRALIQRIQSHLRSRGWVTARVDVDGQPFEAAPPPPVPARS